MLATLGEVSVSLQGWFCGGAHLHEMGRVGRASEA